MHKSGRRERDGARGVLRYCQAREVLGHSRRHNRLRMELTVDDEAAESGCRIHVQRQTAQDALPARYRIVGGHLPLEDVRMLADVLTYGTFPKMRNLKELQLFHSRFADEGMDELCRAVDTQSLQSLNALFLVQCGLTPRGAARLGASLRDSATTLPVLRVVNLNNNARLGDAGVVALTDAVFTHAPVCWERAPPLAQLRTLHLQRTAVRGVEGVVGVFALLTTLRYLNNVHLNGNCLDDAACALFWRSIARSADVVRWRRARLHVDSSSAAQAALRQRLALLELSTLREDPLPSELDDP